MSTKMIFFDIDGTILSHRTCQISDKTRAAIKQAQANGHLAFINTGRTLSEIDTEILDMGFDGLVSGCGTYIACHGEELLHKSIPAETTAMLIRDLKALNIEAVLEGHEAVYYNCSSDNPLLLELRKAQLSHKVSVLSWEEPAVSIDKFCTWGDAPEDVRSFYKKYKTDFDLIDRNDRFYEFIPRGYSKASGIQCLMDHLNISLEDTYCFGDSENDLPMLHYTKNSIAMGNSPQGIKDIAAYVTEDVDRGGIAQGLKHFGLI